MYGYVSESKSQAIWTMGSPHQKKYLKYMSYTGKSSAAIMYSKVQITC